MFSTPLSRSLDCLGLDDRIIEIKTLGENTYMHY